MARSRKKSEAPGGGGEWIVTFSDCMTLLLCFFVMLVTFSSFDDVSRGRFGGAFQSRSFRSIFNIKQEIKDSMFKPVDRPVDRTREGSDLPDLDELTETPRPRDPIEISSTDAYRDRQVFYVPVERMFWGRGTRLKPEGRAKLRLLAGFLRRLPCRVIIAQGPPTPERPSGPGLERAWAVMEYLTGTEGLSPGRFNVSAIASAGVERFRGRPVIEITLLARRVYQ